jgi:hypothetical protein
MEYTRASRALTTHTRSAAVLVSITSHIGSATACGDFAQRQTIQGHQLIAINLPELPFLYAPNLSRIA